MSILTRNSLARHWPLKGDQGLAPAWAASSQINFNMNSIPKLTQGRLANYLPCLAITVWGTVTATHAAAERIRWEDLVCALFSSFDIQGAWHGRPLAAQHMRGATLRIWSYISMGYQSGARRPGPIRASSVAKQFRITVYLPLSHLLGDNPIYSAQLAVLYKDATLYINTPAAGQVGPSGETITIASANMRCSAVLVPQPNLRLAAGCEWLEYKQNGAVAGSDAVELESLGNQTALEGVEPGAGVDTMLALCAPAANTLPVAAADVSILGSFNLSALTQFSAPFIDQTQTQHLDTFLQMWEQASGAGQRPHDQDADDVALGTPVLLAQARDFSGIPYGPGGSGSIGDGTALDPTGLFFPIIVAGPRMQVTKVPVFEGSATYYRTVSSVTNTVDRTLVHQFKSFTPSKHEDFRQLIIEEGLAKAVLGTEDIRPKAAVDTPQGGTPLGRGRFIPVEYVPGDKKAA